MWQAVIETLEYLADARAAGLTEDERSAIVVYLAEHPRSSPELAAHGRYESQGAAKGKAAATAS